MDVWGAGVMDAAGYWQEAFETALDEIGAEVALAALSDDQRKEIGQALAVSHECYGMAFYSPPSTDRIAAVEREQQQKLAKLQRELDAYRDVAEKTVGRILNQHHDARISITKDGDVLRWGGRVERIA